MNKPEMDSMIGRTKNHNPIGPLSPEVAEHLAEAIDTIEFGIMLVAQDGFVTFANKMARQLMQRGEGLRANGGWIAATSAEVTARLRSFVKQSAAETDSERRGGATIVLDRGAGRSSLFLHVMPIARRTGAVAHSVAALIFIIDPDLYALPSFSAFSGLYGLTRSEARVLREIIAGQGLVAASARLRIGEATARTHLQHIFNKTGTKRQTELLCLFFKATLPGQIGDQRTADP
jgi:DNA-binding CsgD family transcriptional regulator